MDTVAKEIDVLIAGQGAAAYAAALYTGRYRMDTVVAGALFGGETATGGLIENYPGSPEIDGYELMLRFKSQVETLGVPIVGEDLADIEVQGQDFMCTLSDGARYLTRSVILAIGRERRTLGLPHEVEWTGKGISYCSTCDAPLHRNSEAVVVVGGGNAAVEGAILIAKYAKTVYLSYRRERLFRPEPILLQTLDKTANINTLFGSQIVELLGDDTKGLAHVRFNKPWGTDEQDVLSVNGLFIEAGADPRNELPKKLGVEIDPTTNELNVDKGQATNIPGLFAAGDITNGSGLKQTITAASQGAIAALSAYDCLLARTAQGATITVA